MKYYTISHKIQVLFSTFYVGFGKWHSKEKNLRKE